MSWSIQFIGKADKVVEAIENFSEKISDQSKIEYDEAKPHLIGLVKQNFGRDYLIRITASGSGYAVGGEQKERSCTCQVELFYGQLV